MMDFLFSILLVPFFPELDDPRRNHAGAITELEQRLSAGQKQAVGEAEPSQDHLKSKGSTLSIESAELPPITGRLFQWSSSQWGDEANRRAAIDLSAESLRLTGLIESAGHQVAILNDGQMDHVVGVGSYVLGLYKVTSFGPGRVVLSRIDARAGDKRLELNLMPVNTFGDAQ
ncbi:conserved hypothetical protein [Limnobacter sp. 130]|jgi:hypothetical protein|uniref:hypothetical protein n=1 Tax=Limnobacter sp. 130 TaxID=2653147 RepID=UPI0012F23890|nr:hypothetical protein [Limnobacter sp. 130]VWX34428.1 conserved hypothetical protein [Limnobacter sp. 130]